MKYKKDGSLEMSISELMPRAERYDKTNGTAYHGWAACGTATSEAKWRIRRIVTTGDDVVIDWADGDSNYDNIWDNRVALSYL